MPHPLASLVLVTLLAACASPTLPVSPPAQPTTPVAQCPPPVAAPAPVCPPCPVCGASSSPLVQTVPPAALPPRLAQWDEIDGWAEDQLSAAWPALLKSCERLARQPQWTTTCNTAATLGRQPGEQAVREFFRAHFSPWQLFAGSREARGLVTGYYEPLIAGSRTADAEYRWPIHGTPPDLINVELAGLHPELKGLRLRGRLVGNKLLPYSSRAELSSAGEDFPAPVLLWAKDPIDLFFLQVQGSGRVELPDGSRVRIGYAEHNGHPYQSIGRWLVDQQQLTLDQASMEGIKQWARSNPTRLQELLNVNPAYVFFRELPSGNQRDGEEEGPIGALGVPLSSGRSIAVDPQHVPLGAPVFLSTTEPLSERPLRRLVLAQDTGGAIKGALRADFFWGFGDQAGRQAGRMRQQGQMWLLLPQGMTPEQ